MVRGLVPGVAPGNTMDDIVLAPFDYARLDSPDANVRIRLDSTCIDVRNADGAVQVGYVRDGKLHRVAARHAVLACFHMMIPHLMPELPADQRDALAQNVKTPIVYTNVLVRNWRPWVELKVSAITAPMSFHSRVALDFPVSLGGYRHPRDPGEPMCLHLVHVAGAPNQGLTARQQFKVGQAKLCRCRSRNSRRGSATSSTACSAPADLRAAATSPQSLSTVGRMATAMWRIRFTTATIMRKPSRGRGRRSAASRSPTPMPAAMPMPIWRSTRRRARCAS